MSKMKRLLMLVICAIFVVSLVSIPKVNAAEPNPWQYTNDEWHFYMNGEPVQGWVTYNGYSYYLNWDGSPYRGTNSFYDETTQKWSYYRFNEKPNDQRPWGGEMITGWYKDGDNWEYYKADGKRASNEWIEINSKWYYIDYRYMAVGRKTIYDKNNNPSTYYFSSSGVMQTNFWYKNQYNEWEYYKANGKAARDEWVQLNSKWYYFSGTAMVTGLRYIKDCYYYFNPSGVMLTNAWYKVSDYGDYYYFKANGKKAVKEWQQIGGKWYYFDSSGYMTKDGRYTINGKLYEFNKSGAMMHENESGWKKVLDANGNVNYWYYVNKGGALAAGWQKINNKWYYFDTYNGIMYNYSSVHTRKIDGKFYCFDKNGAMLGEAGGWIKADPYSWYYDENGNRIIEAYQYYYSNKGGALVTGWKQIGGHWYYFDGNSGRMYQNGTYTINEKQYKFAMNGVLIS